jgi:uncharacterized protein YdhG (YjbR/CyaY superfamily)
VIAMPKTDFKTIDQYVGTFPPGVRDVLETVRETIRKAVPGAEEGISYQMPVFKLDGKTFIFFGGFKQHFSLFPATDGLVAAHPELAERVVSKGTIRFPLDERVPVGLIGKIAKFKAKELREQQAERARAKAGKKAAGNAAKKARTGERAMKR